MAKGGKKLCKYCKSEIPWEAKICPNCRKKQGGKVKWVIIGIVAIAIIGSVAGGKDNDDKVNKVDSTEVVTQKHENSAPETTTEKETSKEDLKFKLGETAEYKDIQVTMTNVTESNGSDFIKPKDGNVFVLVEFEITNNSEKELAISSLMSFDAYQDGYSTSVSLSALTEKDGQQLDGSIAPGKKMKGSVGYEIPSDYKELEINFEPSVWSSKKIVFIYEK